jgi:hypothetical protein
MDGMKWEILVGAATLAAAVGAAAAGGTGCGSDGTTVPPADAGMDSTGIEGGGGDSATPVDAPADVSEAGVGQTSLAFPQLVHGAAYVDKSAFHTIPLLVTTTGAAPARVEVAVDSAPPVVAKATDATHFVATLDAASLSDGAHKLTATAASAGGQTMGTAGGSLVAGINSFQLTKYASAGPAYSSHLEVAPSGDRLAYTWVDVANGHSHQLFLNYLDGAFARLLPSDLVLNDPADEPVTGYTAFSGNDIGVVYNVLNSGTLGHWLVKLRVVDSTGAEKVPATTLTEGGAAFSLATAGADPGGFSAAWLQIQPPDDAGNLPPVQIRYARWDTAKNQLVGPIVLDQDQPQATGSTRGPQQLEPLAEMGIACNKTLCLVLYSRDIYNAFVDLNEPKLFLAIIDLSTGQLSGTPQPVENTDWDGQMFGQEIVALADGTFVLAYTAVDTTAAVTPKSPCDNTIERDLLFTTTIDATGKVNAAPKPVFDFQGSREYPRIAPHPDGWALFWEDQRSECNASGGHIGMAMNVAAPDLGSLLDPYIEATGSIGLPPEYPTIAVTGTNFVASWSDNRDGMGLVQPEPELFFETYWRN